MNKGIVVLYKPSGISSARFLDTFKKECGIKRGTKVGHGGTLDPIAEGVLVVAIGRAYTKQLSTILKSDEKEYVVEMVVGASSDTYDKEGTITQPTSVPQYSDSEIERAIEVVAKRPTQTPPPFSAIKISGEAVYKKARRGEDVSLSPRSVVVKEWGIESIVRDPQLRVRVRLTVSAGFYVRSFVNDVGLDLGAGAYMDALVRTRVGVFSSDRALSVSDCTKNVEAHALFEGNVQMVGFRFSLREQADKEGIVGYAQNNRDGSVELVIQGSAEKLDEFIEYIQQGALSGNVDKIFWYYRKQTENYSEFLVR